MTSNLTFMEQVVLRIAEDLVIAEMDLDEHWKEFAERTEAIEDKLKPKLRDAFTQQEKSVLAKLKRTPIPSIKSVIKIGSEEAEAASEAYVDAVYTASEWQQVFEAVILPSVTEAYRQAGAAAYLEVGLDLSFNVTSPRARKFLQDRAFANVKGINEVTREKLRKALVRGLDAGDDIRKISQRVADVFEINRGSRTNAIAQTEIVGASNNGTHAGYVESELVLTTVWVDSRDDRVRTSPHNHRLDGEEAKLGEKYSNGLLHPHDPNGAAGNVIYCRCTEAAKKLKDVA